MTSSASQQQQQITVKANPHSKEDLLTPENSSFAYASGGPMSRSPPENTPNGSFAENFSFATQQFIERYGEADDAEWSSLVRDIREKVEQSPAPASTSDVHFFEYPQYSNDVVTGRTQPPEEPGLLKLFLGNMRFEMGRQTISWCISKACNVDVPPGRILVHFRAPGKPRPSPTGCASIFLPSEDAKILLDFNQRIFCGGKGIFVAASTDAMQMLIHEKRVVEMAPDGRSRGTKHAMVIEQSRPSPPTSFLQLSFASSSLSSRQDSASSRVSGTFQQSAEPMQQAIYFTYPGPPATEAECVTIENPTEFFIGGICYEATTHFVAWMLSLSGVRVYAHNVTLFQDHKTGCSTGCAMVKVETRDFSRIQLYHHRLLCDSKGVFVSDTPFEAVQAFLRRQKAKGDHQRGPTHAVVIEKRRAQPTPPPPPGYMSEANSQGDYPPPPYVHARTFSFPIVARPMFTPPVAMPNMLPKPTYLNRSSA